MPIPRQAQPSFYETTSVITAEGKTITHAEVEAIIARPRWTFAEANKQATKALNARPVKKVGGRPKAVPRPRPKSS